MAEAAGAKPDLVTICDSCHTPVATFRSGKGWPPEYARIQPGEPCPFCERAGRSGVVLAWIEADLFGQALLGVQEGAADALRRRKNASTARLWEDVKTLRRLAVVGETAMAEGYDAAPFSGNLPAAAEQAWQRLKRALGPAD